MDEKATREQLIDKQLKAAGWYSKYVKEEVNSVKSNFRTKEYILLEGPSDNSGRFIDYLLLAEDNSPVAAIGPLALIEAKKESASVDRGRSQARTYVKDIEKSHWKKL